MKHGQKLKHVGALKEIGASIREKLDKRGWHLCDDDVEGALRYFEKGDNCSRTENEVIGSMKRFITVFEELKKGTT